MSQKEKAVFLRSGKERVILSNRHPWIFSGAVQKIVGSLCPGDIAPLYSHDGTFLAIAYFHPGHSLLGRVLSFERKEIADILQENLKSAYALRKSLLAEGKTNCFRLVNAEEDGLPGLIIDVYGEVFVLQISTLGMERLKPLLLDIMQRTFTFTSLYEKSTSSARALEGLERSEGLLLGQHVEEVDVREEGITFRVAILEGQKTGFFLDQREMRRRVGEISHGKKVLNCFAYTGGFSLYALRGGAVGVTSVDLCPVATRLAKENTLLNGFSLDKHLIVQEDVFAFLQKENLSSYDVIVIDPPAFAKKRQDVEAACKGYQKLMEFALKGCKEGAILLVSSCSHFIDDRLFEQVAFSAARQTQKEVKILSRHLQAMDHPVSLFHPEGGYLKSLLLWIGA